MKDNNLTVPGWDDDAKTVEFLTSSVVLGDIAVMNDAIRQRPTVGIEDRRLCWKVYCSSDDCQRIFTAMLF